ncbi:hypothetical protein [Salinimicrobium sp. TH3]|uniref:hypothetical protein n=1 Tax=Salinimicrobium sp. TH3 TaxID=2997342 RepID=UPI0022762B16|nr:hypothetical protein [Salinimicrobium sp. TH3]MCY2686802.1 hypothetical protein [Salinimicrobium sp. TH3]
MKKIHRLLPIFMIGLFISCKSDWTTDYQNIIKKQKEDFTIVKQADSLEKDSNNRITIYSYESNGISKLEVNSNKYDLFNNQTEYYKNDTLLFVEKVFETIPIIYKRQRKEQEPIGEIIERVSFFKNREYGIEKSRRIVFHLADDLSDEVDKQIEQLKKLDFEIKEIGGKEYSQVQQRYERYNEY